MLALRSKIAAQGLKHVFSPSKRPSTLLKHATKRITGPTTISLQSSFSKFHASQFVQRPAQTITFIGRRSFCTELTHEEAAETSSEPTTVEAALELALPLWTNLELEEAAAVMERFLARPLDSNVLPHIQILQSAQAYVSFGTMLTSLARFDEAIANYTTLIDAAETQISRWTELVSKTVGELNKLAPDDARRQPVVDFLSKIADAKIELDQSLLTYYHDAGVAYVHIGDIMNAHKHFTKSLEIADRLPERENRLIALIHASLSSAYESLGNYKVALEHHKIALRMDPTIEKFEHPNLATILHTTHFLQDTPSERRKLEALLDKSDPNWRDQLITHPRPTSELIDEMIDNTRNKLMPGAAKPVVSELYTPAPDTTEAAETQNTGKNLDVDDSNPLLDSQIYLDLLQTQASEESVMVCDILKHYRIRLGNEHTSLIPLLLHTATLKRRSGFADESLKLIDEALSLVASKKGKTHAMYGTVLMHKSIHHHSIGNLIEAEVFAREAFTLKDELLGSDHIHVGLIAYDLGTILAKRYLQKEALAYFNICAEILKKALFVDHPYYIAAKTAVDQGNHIAAIEQLEEVSPQMHQALSQRET